MDIFEFHYDSIISKYGKHIGRLTTGCCYQLQCDRSSDTDNQCR